MRKTSYLRHVTRLEVFTRYLILGATVGSCGSQLLHIIEMPRNGRLAIRSQTAANPEMEIVLFNRFWKREQDGKMVRRVWFRLASRWLFSQYYPDLDQRQ